MNKKFLSAILFGALMVTSTGTFVSCKDYDDDIENLQGQIDKLASKDELSSQIASLQSALSTAQSAASAAQSEATKALAAATGAEKAAAQAALDAANAKAEAIEAAKTEVAAAKAALEEAVDAKFETFQAELSATVAELTAKVEELTGLTTEMITAINWQEGYDATYGKLCGGGENVDNFPVKLYYAQMPAKWTVGGEDVKSIVFGKDLNGALTLNANETFAKTSYSLVAVSPANAVLTSDMLSLVNSKGESLAELVDIEVKKYEGILTRAASETGLYLVGVTLKKNVTDEKLEKVGLSEVATGTFRYVRYALSAEKDGRSVATPYAACFEAAKQNAPIADFRTKSTIKSSIKAEAPLLEYLNISGGATVNAEKCYPVVSGEAFTIKPGSSDGAILASYVVVDINNASLSTTDKAAINGLSFNGVNSVSMTGVHEITISGSTGVVVPLKVAAIGYDGREVSTTVWVKAGNSAAITQTAAYVVTPKASVATPTAYTYSGMQAFTVPAGAAKMEMSIYAKDQVNIVANGAVLGNPVLKFFKSDKETAATAVKDIAYAQLNAIVNLQTMVDDKVYEGTVKFFNAEGTFLGQSALSIQKVLPKTLPAGFSIKTNQVVNNIYNCYLIPDNAAANQATVGTMAMEQIFNFGEGAPADYKISFAKTALNSAGNAYTETQTVTGASSVSVAKKLIDNATEHATSVVYNYGNITSAKDADGAYIAHKIAVTEFATIFNCVYNDTYTFDWATRAQLGGIYDDKNSDGNYIHALPYKNAVTYGDETFAVSTAHIYGTSAWDSSYSKMLSANTSLAIEEATLTSDANGVEEYFDVTVNGTVLKFTQKSGATNPTAAVPSTLTIKMKDMYGCDKVIKLAITVNKR